MRRLSAVIALAVSIGVGMHAQLPPAQARNIANGNAKRLFGARPAVN